MTSRSSRARSRSRTRASTAGEVKSVESKIRSELSSPSVINQIFDHLNRDDLAAVCSITGHKDRDDLHAACEQLEVKDTNGYKRALFDSEDYAHVLRLKSSDDYWKDGKLYNRYYAILKFALSAIHDAKKKGKTVKRHLQTLGNALDALLKKV